MLKPLEIALLSIAVSSVDITSSANPFAALAAKEGSELLAMI